MDPSAINVDDALVVSENAESILRNELGRHFEMKEESIGPPDYYLGGKVRNVQLENGGGRSEDRRQQVLENAK